MPQAYCVKCRRKREMEDPKKTSFKARGGKRRPALKGTCPSCGTKMFRILSSSEE